MGVVLEPFEREYVFSRSNMLLRVHNACRIDGKQMCMNIYDIRLSDTSPACGMNWPPDLVEVTPYLGVRLPLPASGPPSNGLPLPLSLPPRAAHGCSKRPARRIQTRIMARMFRARRLGAAEPRLPFVDHTNAQTGGEDAGAALCRRSGCDLQLCWPGAVDREARVEGCKGYAGGRDAEMGRQWHRCRDVAGSAGIELCQGVPRLSFCLASLWFLNGCAGLPSVAYGRL